MAGWSAVEMPRQGVRTCGLAPGAEKTTVVIYCGNHVGLFIHVVKRGGGSLYDIEKRIAGD